MIPAKASCPPNWTREYYGYIMAEYFTGRRSMFECVDADQESLPNTHEDKKGALFYHVEADCSSSLPCPPYNQKEINCAVCSK